MTESEAIKSLTTIAEIIPGYCRSEAFSVAIEALEKQIPKKVTLDRQCPTCGADAYANSYDDIKYNFCDNCGQRLDWGDDHDTQA